MGLGRQKVPEIALGAAGAWQEVAAPRPVPIYCLVGVGMGSLGVGRGDPTSAPAPGGEGWAPSAPRAPRHGSRPHGGGSPRAVCKHEAEQELCVGSAWRAILNNK